MGLTKQYLRYVPYSVFGVVGSQRANIIYLTWKGQIDKLCAVAACEHVFIWDIKKGERVAILEGTKHRVTALARSPDKQHMAVGYADGTIRIFHLGTGESDVTFSGHRKEVTALNYDYTGMRLVSGSQDTDVIVWDIVNESGLFRLRGHKGQITQARFLRIKDVLITSATDTFVKFWDLTTQHCFKTVVEHRTKVWDFVVCRKETRLITGSSDNELRVFALGYYDELTDEPHVKRRKLSESSGVEDKEVDAPIGDDEGDEDLRILTVTKLGSIPREAGKGRVMSMQVDATETVLCCHGNDKHMEILRLYDEQETAQHKQKRLKKAKKKARAENGDDAGVTIEDSLQDEMRRVNVCKFSGKVWAFDLHMDTAGNLKLLTLLTSNSIEARSVKVDEKNSEAVVAHRLTMPGHRTSPQTVAFSGDNSAMLSASGECLKVWMRESVQCISNIPCGPAVCSLFAPGDRHAILGTKDGKLQLFDLSAGEMLEEIEAHDDVITTMCMAPNKGSIVTGSTDKDVKFWDFELITDENFSATSKRLTLVHSRTMKMDEGVTCVKYSPDSRLLAVALLDNKAKLFFADTLKFNIELFGHHYPITCMDFSSDSSLIVTGSKDQNCKLWTTDYGDTTKSILAHDKEITCVQFLPKSHMFFSACKGGEIKQWDGDTRDYIQTLKGHHDAVLSMALSSSGAFIISASHDKSLRLWEKTDEPLVLEEERDMEREKEEEEQEVERSGTTVIAGETNQETGLPARKTVETIKSTEKIMLALDLHKEETEKLAMHQEECVATRKELPPPPIHPMFQAFNVETPDRYMLEVLKKVKSSELEESLLVLPFSYVIELLHILHKLIDAVWEVELCCRCLFFLLRIHQGQITSNQVLLPIMEKLEESTLKSTWQVKETIGSNLYAMQALQQLIEEKDEVSFFEDATDQFKKKRRKEKKRAILSIKT